MKCGWCRPLVWKFVAILPAIFVGEASLAAQRYETFTNGAVTAHVSWRDAGGNLINAHDGGILWADGKYHWYGMALRPLPAVNGPDGGQKTMLGVVMYSSSDLYNWTYEGVVLACSPERINPLYCPMRFERPKILYNTKTRQYVMWFHYVGYPGDHGRPVGTGDAGIAVSNHVNGPYMFKGFSRPIDDQSVVRDSTLFQDDDGSAYFLYDRDERGKGVGFGRTLHIVKLTDDYLGFTDQWYKIANAEMREAPVMVKRKGIYYLVTSAESGWVANAANYYRATNIKGPYTALGNPASGPDANVTYQSQGTWALAVHGRKDEFVFMAERHITERMTDCSYIFLPMQFGPDSTLALPYLKAWRWRPWPK